MIPIILFLGLDLQGYLIFQIVQTILDYWFVFLILFLLLKKFTPHVYNRRKLIITCLGIEGVHVVSSFIWYFFVYYAIGGFIIELLFLFLVPYFIIYLLYTPHSETLENPPLEKNVEPMVRTHYLSTGRSWLFYACSIPPSLLLSSFLTSALLNLFGIYNVFIFSY